MTTNRPGSAAGAPKRTFLAIELPLAIRRWVQERQRVYEQHLHAVQLGALFRWTQPEQLHVTLRFLGETSGAQEQRIAAGLAEIVDQQTPFRLSLQNLGCFPSWRAPSVIWIGLRGDLEELARCQERLEQLAQNAGFAAETRPFTPHLTIARTRRNMPRAQLARGGRALYELTKASNNPQPTSAAPFSVERLVFMQSEQLPKGSRYTPLHYFAFGGS